MTAPTETYVGYRYAARSGEKLAHLLLRTWIENPGSTGRPAACGARRQKWRAVHLFNDPSAYRNCPDCDIAAGIAVPDPVRLDTAGHARRGRSVEDLHPFISVPAHPVDPQRAHAALPASHRILRGDYLAVIPKPAEWVFT